jgi:nitroreductase
MDFWQAIEIRHSVREFDARYDVSPAIVRRILHAAIQAPSAGNRQPWYFVVVRRPEVRKQLAAAAFGQDFVAQAPVVIVICTDAQRSQERYGERGAELFCKQDTAAATEHILLAVTSLRMGGCWVGSFDETAVARVLQLLPNLQPVAMVPIGVPARPTQRVTTRRELSDVVTYLE